MLENINSQLTSKNKLDAGHKNPINTDVINFHSLALSSGHSSVLSSTQQPSKKLAQNFSSAISGSGNQRQHQGANGPTGSAGSIGAGQPGIEFDPNDPDYHWYEVESEICKTNEFCTKEKVAELNLMHPAPGLLSNNEPVKHGQTSLAQLGYSHPYDDFGPVVHYISNDGLTVRNQTLKDHQLFPGYVERSVIQRGDTIFIKTIGEGTGAMGGLNELLARPLWNGLVDSHIRYRINLQYRGE